MHDAVFSYLNDLENEDLIGLWNEYCDYTDSNRVYCMYEFDDVVSAVHKGFESPEFNFEDYYFTCDSDGYDLRSSDYVSDLIDIDELVDYICENNDSLGDDTIRRILDNSSYEEGDY